MKVVTIYWLPGWRILYSYQNKRIHLLRQSLQGQKICLHPAIRTDFFLFGTPGIYISLRSILHDSHTLSTAYNFWSCPCIARCFIPVSAILPLLCSHLLWQPVTVNFKLQTSNNIKTKRKLFISVIVSTQGIESSIPSRDIYHKNAWYLKT